MEYFGYVFLFIMVFILEKVIRKSFQGIFGWDITKQGIFWQPVTPNVQRFQVIISGITGLIFAIGMFVFLQICILNLPWIMFEETGKQMSKVMACLLIEIVFWFEIFQNMKNMLSALTGRIQHSKFYDSNSILLSIYGLTIALILKTSSQIVEGIILLVLCLNGYSHKLLFFWVGSWYLYFVASIIEAILKSIKLIVLNGGDVIYTNIFEKHCVDIEDVKIRYEQDSTYAVYIMGERKKRISISSQNLPLYEELGLLKCHDKVNT